MKGYTLIELLVTLGILSALLALALPGFQDVIESS
ncbi:MAG TPA: prepilin-type N-terminal cleavage/methylation domain-containing protein, partial [Gammaproteobacteria bacterium]|nr:prepilin-type N-terminal cleavage/methylation domain-containing protein [Gammaproteobacteria bacterium]